MAARQAAGDASPAPALKAPAPEAPAPATPEGDRRWTCVVCRTPNPMDADACRSCGATIAALLGGAAPASGKIEKVARGIGAGAKEIALVLGLFVVWKLASTVSLMQESGAFSRGHDVWNLERTLHLPSEVAVQRQILGHPAFVQALNVFYLAAHIGGMVALLLWLYFAHRGHYRRWRNVIVAFTAISLLVQFVSVAPPRLLPGLGFVDTAQRYHQSAYTGLGPGLVDQLSSMPSIHVGWAIIVALAVIAASRSRWRWLVVAHPILTTYAVVATANHFWLDAVAAMALVAGVLAVAKRVGRRGSARAATADGRHALPDQARCR